MPRANRPLSPIAHQALRLLGGLIEEGRLRKGWSREMLAERIGVGALTLRRVIRGEPGVALDLLKESLMRLSQMVLDNPEIVELDINPLLVHPEGQSATAADCRMILKAPGHDTKFKD